MALSQVDPSQNLVSPKESYLCLYVYKGNLDECKYLYKRRSFRDFNNYVWVAFHGDKVRIPNPVWSIMQQFTKVIRPDSLNRIVATNLKAQTLSRSNVEQAAQDLSSEDQLYKYIIYIWDGQDTSNQTRANAMVKASELH